MKVDGELSIGLDKIISQVKELARARLTGAQMLETGHNPSCPGTEHNDKK